MPTWHKQHVHHWQLQGEFKSIMKFVIAATINYHLTMGIIILSYQATTPGLTALSFYNSKLVVTGSSTQSLKKTDAESVTETAHHAKWSKTTTRGNKLWMEKDMWKQLSFLQVRHGLCRIESSQCRLVMLNALTIK